MRSGTLQYLHVSEFGKICAQYPDKAREIVTGALNTVEANQFIVIESTAEGQDGAFYRLCQEARERAASGKPVSELDWRFHFFPWWREPAYALPRDPVPIGEEYQRYFEKLEAEGIGLTQGQKAWYVKKDRTMEADMRREYPSTPDEAFEQALEGAYFSTQLAIATKHGRIGAFPVDPRYLVNSFWDLGRNDLNTMWLHQFVAGHHRFVGYYENSGDRKSTRLNSSHLVISYAVFCLKKKKKTKITGEQSVQPDGGERKDKKRRRGKPGTERQATATQEERCA